MKLIMLLFFIIVIHDMKLEAYELQVYYTNNTQETINSEGPMKYLFVPEDDPQEMLVFYDNNFRALSLASVQKFQFRNNNKSDLVFYLKDGTEKAISIDDMEEIEVNPSTGILSESNPQSQLIEVYPNPVKDYIDIIISDEVRGDCNVKVISLFGQTVYNNKVNSKKITWDLTYEGKRISNGCYYVIFEYANQFIAKKFIVN